MEQCRSCVVVLYNLPFSLMSNKLYQNQSQLVLISWAQRNALTESCFPSLMSNLTYVWTRFGIDNTIAAKSDRSGLSILRFGVGKTSAMKIYLPKSEGDLQGILSIYTFSVRAPHGPWLYFPADRRQTPYRVPHQGHPYKKMQSFN